MEPTPAEPATSAVEHVLETKPQGVFPARITPTDKTMVHVFADQASL